MNPIRVNYHTHCQRCRHAAGTAAAYTKEAVKKKLTKLGFSDHLPFPDDRFGLRMPYAEQNAYLQEVTDLKEQYKEKIEIFCGFEGEYFKKDWKYYEALLRHEQCDYLILGQHFFETAGGSIINTYDITDTSLYEDYSRHVVEAMKTGYFRYAAHPDLIFLNPFVWDRHCDKACDILIDGAVKYDFALEYNANGLRRGQQSFPDGTRYPYPHGRFWEKVKGTAIKVYIGSDCHNPKNLWDGYVQKAYAHLEQYGLSVQTDIL